MLRRAWLLPLLWFVPLLPAGQLPASGLVAIIVDDLGNHPYLDRHALDLPGQLTYAVLPQLGRSVRVAEAVRAEGKEVMLHLPMQAINGKAMGPGGLCVRLDRTALVERIRRNLKSVPHAAGVNNHMGSLVTRDADFMRWVVEALQAEGDFYFVDSRTADHSVAERVARQAGMDSSRRDVFLDNEPEPEAIRARLDELVALARGRGTAIGIAHPYPTTLDVLAAEIPQLASRGVRLVPVSQLIAEQRRAEAWPEYSSPLPRVVKNSKP